MDQFGLDIEVQLELDQGEDGEDELWDNKAELDKTTPPHLQVGKMSNIATSKYFVTFALRLVLATVRASEERVSESFGLLSNCFLACRT